jgi:hypothetical protein
MWAVVPSLLLVWLIGLLMSRTGGGWLHVLPVMAIVLAAFLISRRASVFAKEPGEGQDGA